MSVDYVTWLLGGLGIFVVAVAAERGIVLFRTRVDIARLRADLGQALGQRDLLGARMCIVASRSIEAHVVAAGLAALPRGAAAVEERLASEVQMTRLALERGVPALGVVASIAPLVGLLGTVLAFVRAFHAAGCADVPGALAIDIGGALAVTALGLFVAVPALAFSAFLQRQIAARIARAEALGRYMLSFVKDERRPFVKEAA